MYKGRMNIAAFYLVLHTPLLRVTVLFILELRNPQLFVTRTVIDYRETV
jgi:hypothetical protein